MTVIRSRIAGTLLAILALAAAVLVTPDPAQAADVELHARMHATAVYPNAHGGAWYEAHQGWREFGFNVRGLKKLSGKQVTLTVHGTIIGTMRVSQYGTAHLHRHTGIPLCSAGDAVAVTTSAGKLIAYGTLRHRRHHMM